MKPVSSAGDAARDLSISLKRLINEYGFEAVKSEIHKLEVQPRGRKKQWDDAALLTVYLVVQIAINSPSGRNIRVSVAKACERLLKEGPFQPTDGRASASKAGTLKRRYDEAKAWFETLPAPVQDRYQRMIKRSALRGASGIARI